MVVRLWLKWEMLDIQALVEAISGKTKLETKKQKYLNKKVDDQKDLEKLNRGGTTLSTLFKGKDGKVNKITKLTHQITEVSLE